MVLIPRVILHMVLIPRVILHMGLIPRVIPLKLSLYMVPALPMLLRIDSKFETSNFRFKEPAQNTVIETLIFRSYCKTIVRVKK